jgi:hypothetical protein
MKNYDYKLLLGDLSDGREIEFKYNETLYGIVNFSEGWSFIGANKRISEYYANPHELVKTICIEGKRLEEVFNSGDIPDEGFYIL